MYTDLSKIRSSLSDIVLDPRHDCTEHLLLRSYIELFTGDNIHQLVHWQLHEFLTLHHLSTNVQHNGDVIKVHKAICMKSHYKDGYKGPTDCKWNHHTNHCLPWPPGSCVEWTCQQCVGDPGKSECQQMLWCPDSWMGVAAASGTHNIHPGSLAFVVDMLLTKFIKVVNRYWICN